MTGPRDPATPAGEQATYEARACEYLHEALALIEQDAGTIDEVLAAIQLAEVAYRVSLGEVDPSELTDPEPVGGLSWQR